MEIRIPNLGEGADSGSVVSILVKEGDNVAKDQTLVELENEKAVAPIPSTHSGVITKIHVKIGDKVTVGQPIMTLSEAGGSAAPSPGGASQSVPKQTVPQPASLHVSYIPAAPSPGGAPVVASPSVRKMAEELGIDLSSVKGTESGGRIGLADLRNYIQYLLSLASQPRSPRPEAPAGLPKPAETIDFSKWGPVNKKPLSSLRQKIGQKMAESWSTIPHVTQFDEADITSLMALRKTYAAKYEKKGARLTLTSFVIKALTAALKKYPVFNASMDESAHEIVYKEYVHIGVAVDTEAGLIVPVLKDADKKDMFQISKELETLAEKTRSRKVAAEELRGGTFTLSNLGGIGGTFFTPIINKPELAILGVGKGVLKPVVVKTKTKESVETRLLLPLGLSYDHRVIDGADGARFIRAVAEALENFNERDVRL